MPRTWRKTVQRVPLIKECAAITREGAEGREPERMRPERVTQAKNSQHLMRLAIQSAESGKDGQDEANRIPPL